MRSDDESHRLEQENAQLAAEVARLEQARRRHDELLQQKQALLGSREAGADDVKSRVQDVQAGRDAIVTIVTGGGITAAAFALPIVVAVISQTAPSAMPFAIGAFMLAGPLMTAIRMRDRRGQAVATAAGVLLSLKDLGIGVMTAMGAGAAAFCGSVTAQSVDLAELDESGLLDFRIVPDQSTCPAGQTRSGATCAAIVCPTGQKLVGNSCEAIVCSTGQKLAGNSCAAIVCPTGQKLAGNSCAAIVCPTGQKLAGNSCEAIVCPTGQQLAGNDCTAITCPAGERLTGTVCVPECSRWDRVLGRCGAASCPSGQESLDGKCVASQCPANAKLVDGKCVENTCPSGQRSVDGKCVANTCPAGQWPVDGKCVGPTCPAGQRPVDGKCVAAECPDGGKLIDGECVEVAPIPIDSKCGAGMAHIAGGTFPGHAIGAVCMDITEVTVTAYKRCVDQGKCTPPKDMNHDDYCNWGYQGRGANPINCVTWTQAKSYCASLGKRLPSEWEWEWAARGREEGRTYPWGDADPSCKRVQMDDGAGSGCGKDRTASVGSKPLGASRDGVKDLSGNVGEWTATRSGLKVVTRGAGWADDIYEYLSASGRSLDDPAMVGVATGFRCVRSVR